MAENEVKNGSRKSVYTEKFSDGMSLDLQPTYTPTFLHTINLRNPTNGCLHGLLCIIMLPTSRITIYFHFISKCFLSPPI